MIIIYHLIKIEKGGGFMQYKTKEEELANRLFELDEAVYECSKSKLGKVFSASQNVAVTQGIKDLQLGRRKDLINSLTLIENMLKTITDNKDYDKLYQEFLALEEETNQYIENHDEYDAAMTAYNLEARYRKIADRHRIICIGREFGSGGHEIGYKLAKKLGIAFYDKEIFELAADKIDVEDETLKEEDENVRGGLFVGKKIAKNLINYRGLPTGDALFFKQSELITKIAQKEDCVILGRCADVVLEQQGIPAFSVYIGAPFEARVHRKMIIENLTEAEAESLVRQSDKSRKNYYNYYTGRHWGHAGNYDLCVNSACFGIDGTIEIISNMIETAHM